MSKYNNNRTKELKVRAWDISIPLPVNPEPNSIYYVKDGTEFTIVPVDSSGNYLTLSHPETSNSGNIFGSELNVFTQDNVISSNTGTLEEVINETTTSLPPGRYTVKVSYSWNSNCTQHDFESYLTINGLSITEDGSGLIHKEEPKDSAGNWNNTGSLQVLHFNREYTLDLLTTGTRDVLFSFRTSQTNTLASIWDVDIKIYRIN